MMEWHLRVDQEWQAPRAGWLVVSAGTAWLTRQRDCDDHVLSAGSSLPVHPGDRVRLGPWQPGAAAPRVVFVAAQSVSVRRLRGAVLGARRGLVLALRGLAGVFGALARSADAMASRAQGWS